VLHLHRKMTEIPPTLAAQQLTLSDDGADLVYTYDTHGERGISSLLHDLKAAGVSFNDLRTEETSLEDIFVDLVRGDR